MTDYEMEDLPRPMPSLREPDMQRLAEALVASAQAREVELTGEGGLLTVLTKQILQSALGAEMASHLGYDKHDPMGRDGGNSRNGYGVKTVTTTLNTYSRLWPDTEESTRAAVASVFIARADSLRTEAVSQ